MDQDRFDAIIRSLASGGNRRTLLRRMISGVLGGVLAVTGGEALAAAGRVRICHFPPGRARRGVVKIVPRDTLQTHLRHGDFRITGSARRTSAACQTQCRGGRAWCDGICCSSGQSCELRRVGETARDCCPKIRAFALCPPDLICDGGQLCCASQQEASTFCCPEELLCGVTCCDEGYVCLDHATSRCSGPEVFPLAVSYRRLRRP